MGNELRMRHGAGEVGRPDRNPPRPLRVAAEGIARVLLESDYCPEQLLMPVFRAQVESWSRREAQARLIYEWMTGLPVEERVGPVVAGSQVTPVDQWLKAEASAERARDKLGLTPASYAKIRRDLGIAERLADDAVRRLGESGRVIRLARESGEIPPAG